jgi:hypothetical protein
MGGSGATIAPPERSGDYAKAAQELQSITPRSRYDILAATITGAYKALTT